MHERLYRWLRAHFSWLGFIAILLFLNGFVLSALTSRPPLWYDEGMNIELARNFADIGKLDIAIAPGDYTGGAIIGSTGYPVTVPLAFFFKFFGFGLAQARVFMLLWLNLLMFSLFYIFKKRWGSAISLSATALLATFAPLYANGNIVMGEIPGFVLFLWSFYFFEKRTYWFSGLLLGLAVIAKPSIYVFLIPAITILALCGDGLWSKKITNLIKLGLGASMIPILIWLLLYYRELESGVIGAIGSHFKNPYSSVGLSVSENIYSNLSSFFNSTTLIYFLLLGIFILYVITKHREIYTAEKKLFLFSAIYIPLVFFQYLKSLGYLRYLITAECLILILFVYVSYNFTGRERFFQKEFVKHIRFAPIFLGVLILLQGIQLFYFSDLYSSSKVQHAISYLDTAYPYATMGIINSPMIASMIPADKKYQLLETYGLPRFGKNPLELAQEKMPEVLVIDEKSRYLIARQEDILASHYAFDRKLDGGILIYRKEQ